MSLAAATAEERAEVVVVGAGAGGAVLTRALAEAGVNVVCLEQGDWPNPAEYPGERPELELEMEGRWHHSPNVRGLPEDYPCETTDSDIEPLMYNAVGGSTIHYDAQWNRLLPSDFAVRTLDGVGDDWPLDYFELEPYYERIERDLGVSGIAGDPAYPPSAELPLGGLPIGPGGRAAAEGMNRLGWHWWPGTNAIASAPYRRLVACARRGTCGYGCAEGAKGSMDVTHWPDAVRGGARLLTGARAERVLVDERGRASGVAYVDAAGTQRAVHADVVVLAANGIGTPRLLLLSADARHPDGLGNSSGLVGRRLMLHPSSGVGGVYADAIEGQRGPTGNLLYSLEFYETDEARGFPRGAKWDLVPFPGMLMAVQSDLATMDATGAQLHAAVRARVGRTLGWGILAEDLPDEGNHVDLSGSLTDSSGIPAPRIVYRAPKEALDLLAFHEARAHEAHQAAGAAETFTWAPDRYIGWHLLGTARMGTDPTTSVVDPYGRCHDVPNLWVADGSVFVTAGGVNPTATICALALRTAEAILATRGGAA